MTAFLSTLREDSKYIYTYKVSQILMFKDKTEKLMKCQVKMYNNNLKSICIHFGGRSKTGFLGKLYHDFPSCACDKITDLFFKPSIHFIILFYNLNTTPSGKTAYN